jgi:hypothetical protein
VIGGRARHALVNVVALDAVFGIDNVLIIHHTGKGYCQSVVPPVLMCASDCGLTHNTDESIQATLKDRFPNETASIEGIAFGAIKE